MTRRGYRSRLLGGRAGGDGAGGVGDPVRPGADVEGGGDAGQREGEDLVGRGDAGAAVGGHRAVAGRAQGREAGGQVGRRPEGAVRVDVLGRRGADRAGDVTRHRVDVLGLAPVPLPRAGVEQQAGPRDGRRAVGVEQAQLTGARGEAAGRDDRPLRAVDTTG